MKNIFWEGDFCAVFASGVAGILCALVRGFVCGGGGRFKNGAF